jgi:hypothetical protein
MRKGWPFGVMFLGLIGWALAFFMAGCGGAFLPDAPMPLHGAVLGSILIDLDAGGHLEAQATQGAVLAVFTKEATQIEFRAWPNDVYGDVTVSNEACAQFSGEVKWLSAPPNWHVRSWVTCDDKASALYGHSAWLEARP